MAVLEDAACLALYFSFSCSLLLRMKDARGSMRVPAIPANRSNQPGRRTKDPFITTTQSPASTHGPTRPECFHAENKTPAHKRGNQCLAGLTRTRANPGDWSYPK